MKDIEWVSNCFFFFVFFLLVLCRDLQKAVDLLVLCVSEMIFVCCLNQYVLTTFPNFLWNTNDFSEPTNGDFPDRRLFLLARIRLSHFFWVGAFLSRLSFLDWRQIFTALGDFYQLMAAFSRWRTEINYPMKFTIHSRLGLKYMDGRMIAESNVSISNKNLQ